MGADAANRGQQRQRPSRISQQLTSKVMTAENVSVANTPKVISSHHLQKLANLGREAQAVISMLQYFDTGLLSKFGAVVGSCEITQRVGQEKSCVIE